MIWATSTYNFFFLSQELLSFHLKKKKSTLWLHFGMYELLASLLSRCGAIIKQGSPEHQHGSTLTVGLMPKTAANGQAVVQHETPMPIPEGRYRIWTDFITLLRMVCSWKLMNRIFLEFPVNILRLPLIVGNWYQGKWNHRQGGASVIWIPQIISDSHPVPFSQLLPLYELNIRPGLNFCHNSNRFSFHWLRENYMEKISVNNFKVLLYNCFTA